MNESTQSVKRQRRTRQTCRTSTLQNSKNNGTKFQHRATAHHRDVMILMHHFIVHNGYNVLKLPLGPERIFSYNSSCRAAHTGGRLLSLARTTR